jgi:hypothetical protein
MVNAPANQKPDPVGMLIEVQQQIPGRLGHPRTGRMGGDPGQVHPPPVELDHEQYVQPSPANGLHGKEVAAEHPASLGAKESRPAPSAATGRWPEPVAAQEQRARRRIPYSQP